MAATLILAGFLLVALVTDLRWNRIFNWSTYPGILVALSANAAATFGGLPGDDRYGWLGLIGLQESVSGFLVCGFLMVVCYVFFPGGMGGGDVKLMAMTGAFLGIYRGLEVLLWTFTFGGCMAIVGLIWRYGAWCLAVRAAQVAWYSLRYRTWVTPTAAERAPLHAKLALSPSALLAVCVVQVPPLYWP